MTQPEQQQRPTVAMTPESSAGGTAAFCLVSAAVLVWPLHRMWSAPVREWQMLGPTLALVAFMFVFAFVAAVRYLALTRSRQRRLATGSPARHPRRERRQPARPEAPVVVTQPVIEAPEPFRFTRDYPTPPPQLGPAFAFIMEVIRDLPVRRDSILHELVEAYEEASRVPGFAATEAFLISKIERRRDYDPDINSGRDSTNVALYMAQADEVLPYAAIVAGMVLIAGELPEQVWDVLARPWENVGLPFPEVVLAG